MANYSFYCLTINHSISRQQHRTFYLFSILVFLLAIGNFKAQDTLRYREIEIIRPELFKASINPTKIQQGLKIYHFGDSHIQGDRISGEIRDG